MGKIHSSPDEAPDAPMLGGKRARGKCGYSNETLTGVANQFAMHSWWYDSQ